MREQAEDNVGANRIIAGSMIQYNNDRLHKENGEAAKEVDVAMKIEPIPEVKSGNKEVEAACTGEVND